MSVSHGRAERVAKWIAGFGSYADLDATISDILNSLVFGTKAEKFENALDELSRALGFAGERPDAEWKEGPDNLWALDDTQYLLLECKSEVEVLRSDVNKREAEQMNRSNAWFDKHYAKMNVKRVIVHPASKVASAAAFTHPVEVMRESDLMNLVKACRELFKSFELQNLNDLSSTYIQKMINAHKLDVKDITDRYSRKLKDIK